MPHGLQVGVPLWEQTEQSSGAWSTSWSSWRTWIWQSSVTHRHIHPLLWSLLGEVWSTPEMQNTIVGQTLTPHSKLLQLNNADGKSSIHLNKHHHTFAQNLADRSFVVIVTLKDFLLQELSCGQMKCFIWPVEPAAIQPLLPCIYQTWKKTEFIRMEWCLTQLEHWLKILYVKKMQEIWRRH